MKIIFFTHPDFLHHQSMPRFANMLAKGMEHRGHDVSLWMPKPIFVRLSNIKTIKKWLGYIDQYIIFPIKIKSQLNKIANDTLFVFCDHALGPWIPLVSNRAHIIHCHDFLAQQSALGQIPQNPTGFTGKVYQKFIQKGYNKGKNFISVSQKTKNDLSYFLRKPALSSTVVYNGLNRVFAPKPKVETRELLSKYLGSNIKGGYILHVGGNQWYKNRLGVIEIYDAWRAYYKRDLPLILLGEKPNDILLSRKKLSEFKDDIIFLSGVDDEFVDKFYAAASVFLFPSLAEGFGWPIAEAMASKSLVITTNEAPMNEVALDAGFYIKIMPSLTEKIIEWANESSHVLERVLSLSSKERSAFELKGLENAKRFDQKDALDSIEKIYLQILDQENK